LAANQLSEEAISSVISKTNSSGAQLTGSWPVMKSSVLHGMHEEEYNKLCCGPRLGYIFWRTAVASDLGFFPFLPRSHHLRALQCNRNLHWYMEKI